MSYIKYHFSDWKGRMPSQAGYEGEDDYPKQYKVTPTPIPDTYVSKSREYKVYANIQHKENK